MKMPGSMKYVVCGLISGLLVIVILCHMDAFSIVFYDFNLKKEISVFNLVQGGIATGHSVSKTTISSESTVSAKLACPATLNEEFMYDSLNYLVKDLNFSVKLSHGGNSNVEKSSNSWIIIKTHVGLRSCHLNLSPILMIRDFIPISLKSSCNQCGTVMTS